MSHYLEEREQRRETYRQAVLFVLRSDPSAVMDIARVVEETGLSVLDAVLAVGSLAYDGLVERVGPGRYRHTDVLLPCPMEPLPATARRSA